jgi:hypothetical protein
MEPTEMQARATIAAALILTRAVEIPTIPTSGDWSRDTAALRLRDLTDYVFQMITSPQPRGSPCATSSERLTPPGVRAAL